MNLESFLHAMRESPDDLGQRLIFADWLEDNGDPDRAELVRLQCSAPPYPPWDWRDGVADTPRERELIEAIAARWLGDADQRECDGVSVYFRRGMVRLRCRPDGLAAERDWLSELLRSGWVERYELAVYDAGDLVQLPTTDLSHVNWLSLYLDFPDPAEVAAFLARLPHLQRLEIHRVQAWDGVADTLAGLPRLESLSWVNPLQIEPLLPVLSRLKALDLYEEAIDNDTLDRILDALGDGQLRVLSLKQANLPYWEGIAEFADCGKLRNLTALALDSALLDDESVGQLADSPYLRRLVHLSLCYNELTHAGIPLLADSPILANLATLNLSGNTLRSEGAKRLADSPHLGKLKRLWLNHCHIGESGARELVFSDRLAELIEIDLGANPIEHVSGADRMTLEKWRQLFGWSGSDNPSSQEVRELCVLLRDGSPPMRRRAAGILCRLWKRGYDQLPAEVDAVMVRALDDSEAEVRGQAIDALTVNAPGIAVLPDLLELLESKNDFTRSRVLAMIAALGVAAFEAEAELLRLESDEPALAQALASIGASSADAIERFRLWVRSEKSEAAALAAAWGLARQRLDCPAVIRVWWRSASQGRAMTDAFRDTLASWPEALSRLLEFHDDCQWEVRGAVADILGFVQPMPGAIVAILSGLLKDEHRSPREKACAAIVRGRWRSHEFVGPLIGWLDDHGADAERAAIQALRVQGEFASAAVPDLLRVGIERRHADAFLLCRDLGGATQQHAEAFRQQLRRDSPVELRLAEMVLRQCAAQWPDAEAILRDWRNDPCPSVRETAARVREGMGAKRREE